MRMGYYAKTIVLAAVLALTGVGVAADAADENWERLKEDAEALGREYARKGEEIADDAADYAEKVAENFEEAYEKSKEDAVKR